MVDLAQLLNIIDVALRPIISVATLIILWMTFNRTQRIGEQATELHHLVNSTAEQLRVATKEGAFAEGKAVGLEQAVQAADPVNKDLKG